MSFGQRLRDRRKELGISQGQLAKSLGVSVAAVSNYENGLNAVREEVLLRMLRALDVDPNYLYQDDFQGSAFTCTVEEQSLVRKYRNLRTSGRQALHAVANTLGAYQVLFMDRVPDSAAVDQAVEMVKRRKHQRSSGMVNAVLRRLSREKDHLPALPEGTAQERLSLQYSHPAWLTGRLLDLLGPEEAEAFLRLDNGSVPTAIQRNPLRCTPEELVSSLEAAGAKLTPHPLLPDCWYMTGGGDVQAMEAFQKGFFQVQDPAAKAAVLAAGPRPGDRVLDV